MRQPYHPLAPRAAPGLLSLVIPVYNEQEALPHLRQRLTSFIDGLPMMAEVVIVNDGSSDSTMELLLDWAQHDPRVRVLGLARNFGHQAAVTAGLDLARGDAVVIMDADLQDPPEVVVDMIREYCRGYDVVYGRRAHRAGEGIVKRATAWAFYRLMRLLTHTDLPEDTGDFRLIARACLEAVRSMRETHRFLRGMVAWVGFPQTAVRFERDPRVAGRTKYSLPAMVRLAWTAAISFSAAPLRIILALGAVLAALGLIGGIYAIGRAEFGHNKHLEGWTTVIAVLSLIGGGILIAIGILGEYVGRIFEECKGRPLYVVSLRANVDDSENHSPSTEDSRRPAYTARPGERIG